MGTLPVEAFPIAVEEGDVSDGAIGVIKED